MHHTEFDDDNEIPMCEAHCHDDANQTNISKRTGCILWTAIIGLMFIASYCKREPAKSIDRAQTTTAQMVHKVHTHHQR